MATGNTAIGTSLTINSAIFRGNFNDIALPSDQQRVERWFNVDAGFERNSALQLDTGRQIRTFPLRLGNVRGDNINNYDLSMFKNTRIAEGKDIQFRAEFLNAMNHPLFPSPAGNAANPANATFGQINAANQANYARRIQLSLKFVF